MMRERRGFVLLAVLVTLVLAGAAAARGLETGRMRFDEAANRRAIGAGVLRADGCADAAIARMDRLGPVGDRQSAAPLEVDGCRVELRSGGARFPLAYLDGPGLRRLLESAGIAESRALPIVDAVLDWRDADDSPRPEGAERAWYLDHGLTPPRNAEFSSVAELWLVRGMRDLSPAESAAVATAIGDDVEPIDVDAATAPALAALPGMTTSMANWMVLFRATHPAMDLPAAAAAGPRSLRDSLAAHAIVLSQLIGAGVRTWVLTARTLATEHSSAVVELRMIRNADGTAAVRRRRAWIE